MKYRNILLAALFAASATQASAATRSEASVSGLRYTLIDLDTSDSIAPSVTFSPHWVAAVILETYSNNAGIDTASIYEGAPDPVAGTISIPVATASGSVVQRESVWTEIVSGTAQIDVAGIDAGYVRAYMAGAGTPLDFTLSARTALVFSLDSHIAFETDDLRGEQAETTTWGSGSLLTGSGWSSHESSDSRSFGIAWGSDTAPVFDSTLDIKIANDDANTASGTFTFGLRTQVTNVSSIPEPSTYAMLLGGLGLLAFGSRRHKP